MFSPRSNNKTKHVSFLNSQDESGIELFSDFENSPDPTAKNSSYSVHGVTENHLTSKPVILQHSSLKEYTNQPVSILKKPSCREKTCWPYKVIRSKINFEDREINQTTGSLYIDDYDYTITDDPVYTFQNLVALCVCFISFTAFCLMTFFPSLFDLKNRNEELILYLEGERGIYVVWFLICCCIATIAGFCIGAFSWIIHYFDSYDPGIMPPTPCSQVEINGSKPARVVHMGYAISVANGVAGFFACLTYLGDQYVV